MEDFTRWPIGLFQLRLDASGRLLVPAYIRNFLRGIRTFGVSTVENHTVLLHPSAGEIRMDASGRIRLPLHVLRQVPLAGAPVFMQCKRGNLVVRPESMFPPFRPTYAEALQTLRNTGLR